MYRNINTKALLEQIDIIIVKYLFAGYDWNRSLIQFSTETIPLGQALGNKPSLWLNKRAIPFTTSE